jgi:hypothetical protein
MKNGFKFNSDEDKYYIYFDDIGKKVLVYNTPKPFILRIGGKGPQSATDTTPTIPPQLYSVLKVLVEHPGRVFTRDEIATHLIGTSNKDFIKQGGYAQQEQYVNVRMSNLRKKLGPIMGNQIMTTKGGYVYEEKI